MSAATDHDRRVHAASAAIHAYSQCPGTDEGLHCQVIDLFADLLHFAHSMGIDGEDCYRIGCGHYRAEQNDEEGGNGAD